MLQIRFLKFQPSEYVLRYHKGKLASQGAGASFHCYLPATSVAVLPVGSIDAPFIFEEKTADFQSVTVQGQLVFRIADHQRTAAMLDYTIHPRTMQYLSEDPKKLPQRMINAVKVSAKRQVEHMSLQQAMGASEALARQISADLTGSAEIDALGVEVLGVSILAVLANKETARALEAKTREQILKAADDAVYQRRNASIEQERRVKENEFNTEISVENKKRQVRETQLEAEQAVQHKQNLLQEEQLLSEIKLEQMRQELVALESENFRAQADASAYALSASMGAVGNVDPTIIKALASVGMQPDQVMALAFQGIADNADKIGQLNITPDLLREMLQGDRGCA